MEPTKNGYLGVDFIRLGHVWVKIGPTMGFSGPSS